MTIQCRSQWEADCVLPLGHEGPHMGFTEHALAAQLEVAQAGYTAAVQTARWQASTNRELNELSERVRALDEVAEREHGLRVAAEARLVEAENMNAAAEKIALRLAVASLLCASQADDPALRVLDPTITEAALQRALRDLHRAIEGTANSASAPPAKKGGPHCDHRHCTIVAYDEGIQRWSCGRIEG